MSKGSRVRVVAGAAGGLWLKVPRKFHSRPTQERVKEAVFSSIGPRIEEAKCFDLFAGSGSLGIEALSRGAASCTFVEAKREYIANIRENLKSCSLDGNVINQDAVAFLSSAPAVDLIFLDPPYEKEATRLEETPLYTELARRVRDDHSLIIWEHDRRSTLATSEDIRLKSKTYGESAISYLSPA